MLDGKAIQIDNGEFVRIHWAILEKLATARLSGAEYRCVLFLLRKTYGWNKKEDQISLSQWAEGTEAKRHHVMKTLRELTRKKIIYSRDSGGQIPFYGFNKYFEEWEEVDPDVERGNHFLKEELLPNQVTVEKVLPEQVTVTRTGNSGVTRLGNSTVTRTGNNKRHIKDTIKDNSPAPHQKIFSSLVRICRLDPKLKGGQIGKTAKALVVAEYTPEDVDNFETWWKLHDFRGQKNQPPTLSQVLDRIAQAKLETPHRELKEAAPIELVQVEYGGEG